MHFEIDSYSKRDIIPIEKQGADLFFVGTEKGRFDILIGIFNNAKEHNISTDFKIFNLRDNQNIPKDIERIDKTIPYEKMLSLMINTRCILEVLAEGQNSSSLRYYEAIVYNKKLLTNNPNVFNMPFYNPKYIQYFNKVEDIDFEWIREDVEVDYGYNGEFDEDKFIETLITKFTNPKNVEKESDNLVSVVLPTYNRSKTILRAVYSVLNQTYSNLELIVVDDGSTDNTLELLATIDDTRLKIISQDNQGAGKARNSGIAQCRGKYIAFQDSDDFWKLDKLERQVAILDGDIGVDAVFCNATRHDVNYECRSLVNINTSRYVSRNELQGISLASTQNLILRRECLEKEKFDEEMPRLQDYDLVIRLAESFSFYYLNEALVDMYVQEDSISNNPGKAIVARKRLLQKYPHIVQRNFMMLKSTLGSILKNSKELDIRDIEAEREMALVKKIEALNKQQSNMGRKIISIPFSTARIDVKLFGEGNEENSLRIVNISDKAAKCEMPAWLNKDGKGYVIQTSERKITFALQCSMVGKLSVNLRGNDVRNNEDRRLPVWVEYTSFMVEGKEILQNSTPTWHDRPFTYEMTVKAGDLMTFEVEWKPYEKLSEEPQLLKKSLAKLEEEKAISEEMLKNQLSELSQEKAKSRQELKQQLAKFACEKEELVKETKDAEKKCKELEQQLHSIENGWSFRIGRVITWLPRKLLGRNW